jgi:hypothetical protein
MTPKSVLALAWIGVVAAQASTVVVALKHDGAKLAALEAKVLQVADVANEQHYGRWLSNADLVPYLAASAAQASAVRAWLDAEADACNGGASSVPLVCSLVGPGDFFECSGFASPACARAAAARWQAHVSEVSDGAFVKGEAFGFHASGVPAHGASSSASPAAANAAAHFAKLRGFEGAHLAAGLEAVGSPNAQREAYGIPLDATAGITPPPTPHPAPHHLHLYCFAVLHTTRTRTL